LNFNQTHFIRDFLGQLFLQQSGEQKGEVVINWTLLLLPTDPSGLNAALEMIKNDSILMPSREKSLKTTFKIITNYNKLRKNGEGFNSPPTAA